MKSRRSVRERVVAMLLALLMVVGIMAPQSVTAEDESGTATLTISGDTTCHTGDTIALTATYTAADDTATDVTAVAAWTATSGTINAGSYTAAASGTATVTAAYNGLSATYEVTVSDAETTPTPTPTEEPTPTPEPTYILSGTITANGAAVGGAEVTVAKSGDAGTTYSATTDERNGTYTVSVPNGTYYISAIEKNGSTLTGDSGSAATISGANATLNAGITLTASISGYEFSTEMPVGTTVKLTATLNNSVSSTGISWSSNNTDTATIDANGNLTAVKAGTTTITAAVTTAFGNVSVSENLTVREATASVTNVSCTVTERTKWNESDSLGAEITVKGEAGNKVTVGKVEVVLYSVQDQGFHSQGGESWITSEEISYNDGFNFTYEGYIKGKYKIVATYLGETDYYKADAEGMTITKDTEIPEVAIKTVIVNDDDEGTDLSEVKVEYGTDLILTANKSEFIGDEKVEGVDKDDLDFFFIVDANDITDVSFYTAGEDGEYTESVTITGETEIDAGTDDSVCLKFNKVGTYTLTIGREEISETSGNTTTVKYGEVTAEITIKVNPKKIELANTEGTEVTYTKVYDKEFGFDSAQAGKEGYVGDSWSGVDTIGFAINAIEGEDEVTVASIAGKLGEKDADTYENAGTYENATLTITSAVLSGDDGANYEVTECTVTAAVTIKTRPIYLQVSDGTRSYGAYNEVTYNNKENPVSEWKGFDDFNSETMGIVDGNDNSVTMPTPHEVAKGKVDYEPGTEADKLTVYEKTDDNKTNGDPGNNYYFVYATSDTDTNVDMGDLTITQEENCSGDIEIKEGNEVYKATDGTVWVDGSVTDLQIYSTVSDPYRGYDQVYWVYEDGNNKTESLVSDKDEASGVNVSKLTDGKEDGSAEIKIYLKNSKNGAKTEPFYVTIYVDNKDPILVENFITNRKSALSNALETITFGLFQNEETDGQEAEAKVSDGNGSGIKAWYYNIMTGKNDSEFTTEAITTYVGGETCSWTTVPEKKSDKDTAELTGTITLPKEENNYVLLIKAVDNVGHTVIFTSNGFVIDWDDPYAEINMAKEQITSSTGIYADDINLSITLVDPINDGVTSSIKKATIIVEADGEKTQEYTLYDIEDTENGGVKKTGSEKNGSEGWTLSDLSNNRSKTIDYTIEAAKNNSNNVKVTVTVYDNAGNWSETSETYMIDTTRPTVSVEYASEATAQNGYYYNKPIKATITYTERNFSKEFSENSEYLWFAVSSEKVEIGNYSLDQLSSLFGIGVEWDDSEDVNTQDGEDIPKSEYTDARTHKLILTFDADDHYTFTPYCRDLAKTTKTTESVVEEDFTEAAAGTGKEFVIDQTAPVMTVTYSTTDGSVTVPTSESNRVYKNKDITEMVTITEHNFVLDDADVQIEMTVGATKVGDGEVTDYASLAKRSSKWRSNGDVRTSTYLFGTDANYTNQITYTDLAGNTATYGTGYFTVDKTKPTGTITEGATGFFSKVWENITDLLNKTFGLFSNQNVSVTVSGDDVTSPVYNVQYARFPEAKSRDTLESYTGWTTGSGSSASFSVSPNEQFITYMKVTDYAGNYEYYSSDGVVVDQTKPAPKVTITNLSQAQNGIFNEDVVLQIDVEDPTAGGTYSGLEKVWYTVTATGNVNKESGEIVLLNNTTKTQGTKTQSFTVTIPAQTYNSNNVVVKAYATDFSENTGESEETTLKIDVTNPTISVSWDLTSPQNGRYYKDTRTATVTITDRNFDPNNVNFHITNSDGTAATLGSWSSSSNIGVSDSATSTCTVSFPADGDYTFTLDCVDLAGNTGSYGQTDEFTIDKTVPTISVSYDNDDAKNGSYYKESRTATITIVEHNFDASSVHVTTTASNSGKTLSAPTVSGWSTSGDSHTATVTFDEDADYTLDVEYTDQAGNAAADYDMDSFTVDLTNPELEITGVENKSANKGTVAPVIRVSDTNFANDGVTYTLVGANKGKIDVDSMVSISNTSTGTTVTFKNFGSGMDDIYTLTATSVDKAGNETTKFITFSVNRDGSTYKLSSSTEELIDKGYTNDPIDLEVEEINVDTLELIELTVSRDGKVIELVEGEDYTVEVTDEDGEWKHYVYHINASVFEEEGKYIVTIYSEDSAENSSNNQTKKKNIEFTVDKTAPTIIVSNLVSGRYRESSHLFTLTAKDNTVLSAVELWIDGELIHTYTGDELTDTDGVLDITIDGKDAYQDIELIAYDEAGNATDPVDYRVLVTANRWVQFYNNKPLFFGSILALLALIALIFFIILWKRRKDEEEEENTNAAANR